DAPAEARGHGGNADCAARGREEGGDAGRDPVAPCDAPRHGRLWLDHGRADDRLVLVPPLDVSADTLAKRRRRPPAELLQRAFAGDLLAAEVAAPRLGVLDLDVAEQVLHGGRDL